MVAGSPDGWQENTIGTYRRTAVGVCAVAIALLFGLLFGGFGVAAAATETGDSVGDTRGLDGPGQEAGTTEAEPAVSPPQTSNPDTIPEFHAALNTELVTSSEPDQEEIRPRSVDLTGPISIGMSAADEVVTAPAAEQDDKGSDAALNNELVARSEPDQEEIRPKSVDLTGPISVDLIGPMMIGTSTVDEVVTAPSAEQDDNDSDSGSAAVSEQATEPEVVISHSPATEPPSTAAAVDADVTPLADDPAPQVPTAVQPVTTETLPIDNPSGPSQAEVVQPASSAAPVNGAMTPLAYLIMALKHGAAPWFELPADLLSLLGFPPMSEGRTVSTTGGGIGGSLLAGGPYAAAHTPMPWSRAVQGGWPEMLIAPGDSGALLSGRVGAHSVIEGVAAGAADQPPSGLDAMMPDAVAAEVRSVFEHTVGAVLAPLSLLALLATASPGLSGLLLLISAGMFVGYRQARAASMLRAVGIARFAKAGPLGVVRSGGQIAVHPRSVHAGGRHLSGAGRLLESVA